MEAAQHVGAELGDLVERFDHVSLAVWDIGRSLALPELLGGRFRSGGDHPASGFRWIQFHLPTAGRLEMVQPLDPADADHFLVRFLRTRGEGLHHLTFKVRAIHEAIERAETAGFDVVQRSTDNETWREAFLHPRSSHGVLVQLAEWTDKPDPAGVTIEDVLAGRRTR